MLHDVVKATYRGDYQIELQFEDGQRGIVDFSKYLQRGGVFERFKDIEFFRAFSVDPEFGTLIWGEEVDVAPETLYAAATGSKLPAWMETQEISNARKGSQRD